MKCYQYSQLFEDQNPEESPENETIIWDHFALECLTTWEAATERQSLTCDILWGKKYRSGDII